MASSPRHSEIVAVDNAMSPSAADVANANPIPPHCIVFQSKYPKPADDMEWQERAKALVEMGKRRCPDYMTADNQPEKYTCFEDMVGHDLTSAELKCILDGMFLISDDVDLHLIDEHNRWAAHRAANNKRGDESSIEARAVGVERVGVLPDSREPPWLMKTTVKGHWDLLGGATLYAEGARRAYERDAKKKNRQVQLSVRVPIHKCKEYTVNMSKVSQEWLVEFGNQVNGESTDSTILESWRSTKRDAAGFLPFKETNKGLSQKAMNQKRIEHAKSLNPKRWMGVQAYVYMQAQSFYEKSQTKRIEETFTGFTITPSRTVWGDVEHQFNSRIDMTHSLMQVQRHPQLFIQANLLFRNLKNDYPEFIAPLLTLVCPTVKPLAICSFCPEGLNPERVPAVEKITQEQLDALMQSMEQSKTIELMANPEKDPEITKARDKHRKDEENKTNR